MIDGTAFDEPPAAAVAETILVWPAITISKPGHGKILLNTCSTVMGGSMAELGWASSELLRPGSLAVKRIGPETVDRILSTAWKA